jgi:hypothetical protein
MMNADEARKLTEQAEEKYFEGVDVSQFLKVIAFKAKVRERSVFFAFPNHRKTPTKDQLDKLRHLKYEISVSEPFNNDGDTDYNLRISW